MFIVPPLYRHQPLWYHRNLALVATRFSQALSTAPPLNLHLLPSFTSQDLCPDGVFLTPVSGLHYVIHVFDQTSRQLELLQGDSDARLVQVQESVRHHDDRLSYLEGRHDRLSVSHDTKLAADAEFRDWMINRSEESWLTIQGLPRLGQKGRREWQDAARKQVNDLFRLTLKLNKIHLDYKVIVVSNPLRFRTSGVPVLNVKLDSIEASETIRELYSGFFRRDRPVPLPAHLKGVSVRNKVTKETRVRIAILQQLGANFVSRNPGTTIKVRGYDPRPTLLVLSPTSGGPDGSAVASTKLYNFIEAVTSLPSSLSDDNLSRIFGVIGASYPGQLRNLFVIISDDDRERCQGLVRRRAAPSATPSATPSVSFAPAASGTSSAQAMGGRVATSGGGMELVSGFQASLARPPPPPPPLPRDRSVSSSASPPRRRLRSTPASRSPSPAKRGLKRRHLSSDSSTDQKRPRRSRSPSTSSSSSADSSASASGSSSSPAPRRKSGKSSKRRKSGKRSHGRKSAPKRGSEKPGKSGSGKSSSAKYREK